MSFGAVGLSVMLEGLGFRAIHLSVLCRGCHCVKHTDIKEVQILVITRTAHDVCIDMDMRGSRYTHT